MIRTALLAGIFLVLLSIAYSRPGPGLLPALKEEVASAKVEPPAKHVAQAPVAAPAPAPMPEPVHREEPIAVPAVAEAAPAPLPSPAAPAAPVVASAAPVVAQDAPHDQPKSAGQPVSLLPPEMQHPQAAAAEPVRPAPAPLLPPEVTQAAVQAPALPAPAAPPALTPAAEMPTIPVVARPAVAPWEAPAGTAHATAPAVADPGAKQTAEAPKFMTPQERSKELYRLAREMEDTFIHKLAR